MAVDRSDQRKDSLVAPATAKKAVPPETPESKFFCLPPFITVDTKPLGQVSPQ